MVTITPAAWDHFAEMIIKRKPKEGCFTAVVLGVKTTGCSGMAYTFEYADVPYVVDGERLEETAKAQAQFYEDVKFQGDISRNIHFCISSKAWPIVIGCTIDYVKKGLQEGLKIDNPNETGRCGCGESFRT